MEQVEYASNLIDSYLGFTIGENTMTEPMIKPNRNNICVLKHHPVLSVTEIKGIQMSPFGITEVDMDVSSVYFVDDYGRFMLNYGSSLGINIWGIPKTFKVTYKWGWSSIPEEIKRVCAAIATSLSKAESMGGFTGAKIVTSLDFSVTMFNDSIISSSELSILNKYKVI
jgi:hypothetical protein